MRILQKSGSCWNKAAIIPKNKIVQHVQIKDDSYLKSTFSADSSKICQIKVLSKDTDASYQKIVQRGNTNSSNRFLPSDFKYNHDI